MSQNVSFQTLVDKWLGCLEAGALADALGAPHELKIKSGPYTGVLQYKTTIGRRYHPPVILEVGVVTDDTDMTLALTRSILKFGYWEQNDVIDEYLKWANNNTYYLGKGTRRYLVGLKTVKNFLKRKASLDAEYGENQQGDGPLMRAAALAFTSNSQVWMEDCGITNNNIVSKLCVLLYVQLLRACLFDWSFDQKMFIISDFFYKYRDVDVLTKVYWDILENKPRDVNENKSWIVHALYCGLYGLIYFRNDGNRIKIVTDYIISLGGDTDTNARIAACLIGAEEGSAKIKTFDINIYNLNILYNANPSLNVLYQQADGLARITQF